MTPTVQWLNDNWFQIVGPVVLVAVAGFGGLWLRRLVFDAISQSHLREKWRPSGLVLRHCWGPFLHWFMALGVLVAVNVSALPAPITFVLNRVILSLWLMSLAWLVAGAGVDLFLYYEVEFRKYMESIKAPQLPRAIIVNTFRALVALVTMLLLLRTWQGPDVSGLLALVAFAVVGGLALRDAAESTVSRRLRQATRPLRNRRLQKIALSLIAVILLVDVFRRLVLMPSGPSPEQNAAILWTVVEVAGLLWAIGSLRRSLYSRTRPRFAVVAASTLVPLLILTMLGLEPVSGYVSMIWSEMRSDLTQVQWETVVPAPASEDVSNVAKQVLPAVVLVLANDAQGTGMIVSPDGAVLTCQHVVEGCERPRVIVAHEYYYDCRVSTSNADTDLAVLIPDRAVPTSECVRFGSIRDVQPGDELWVIGYALGIEGDASVTKGIASAIRQIDAVTYLQTDAPINPGNSGGPIVDKRGRVVAVAAWKIAEVDIEGMQFGVAIDHADPLLALAETAATPQSQAPSGSIGMERQVVASANAERQARGAAALVWDEELAAIALAHAEAMASRGEMFHSSVDRPYAENCWMGSATYHDAETIVQSWMASDHHRTWLLCPSLKHVGVGISRNGASMYAAWTFWRAETASSDWWYQYGTAKPNWWY